VAFDVALIACPVMQFYCGTPMYLLSGVDTERQKAARTRLYLIEGTPS